MFTDAKLINDQTDSYHDLDSWSYSSLKLLPDDPKAFEGFHIAVPPRWPRETTDAMRFGTKLHCRLLEPDKFEGRYPRSKPCCGVLKSGKRAGMTCGANASMRTSLGEWYCGTHAKGVDCHEVDCISDDDGFKINEIHKSCMADPLIRSLLECPGDVEYSISATHITTGLPARGRIDKVCRLPAGRFIIDPKAFAKNPAIERLVAAEIAEKKYYRQGAMYLDLMAALNQQCDGFANIFCKTSPPYSAVLWIMQEADIEIGRRHNEKAFIALRDRIQSGNWNDAVTHGQKNYVQMPKWFYDRAYSPDYSSDFSDFQYAGNEP